MIINMLDVQRGYDAWAAKPHNAKWVRKIDGTPIANDIVATIWNTLRDIIEERETPSPAPNLRGGAEPTKRQVEAAIEAYNGGSYLNDEQVLASVIAIVRAALAAEGRE